MSPFLLLLPVEKDDMIDEDEAIAHDWEETNELASNFFTLEQWFSTFFLFPKTSSTPLPKPNY